MIKDFFGSRDDYHAQLQGKILGKENCPFCSENLDLRSVVWEWKYWRIVYNKFPYTGNDRHLLAVPKDHKIFSYDLTKQEYKEMKEVQKFMQWYFGEQKYFSFTREAFGQRSVEHLHMHFLAGIIQGKFLRKMLELQGFPIQQNLHID